MDWDTKIWSPPENISYFQKVRQNHHRHRGPQNWMVLSTISHHPITTHFLAFFSLKTHTHTHTYTPFLSHFSLKKNKINKNYDQWIKHPPNLHRHHKHGRCSGHQFRRQLLLLLLLYRRFSNTQKCNQFFFLIILQKWLLEFMGMYYFIGIRVLLIWSCPLFQRSYLQEPRPRSHLSRY